MIQSLNENSPIHYLMRLFLYFQAGLTIFSLSQTRILDADPLAFSYLIRSLLIFFFTCQPSEVKRYFCLGLLGLSGNVNSISACSKPAFM